MLFHSAHLISFRIQVSKICHRFRLSNVNDRAKRRLNFIGAFVDGIEILRSHPVCVESRLVSRNAASQPASQPVSQSESQTFPLASFVLVRAKIEINFNLFPRCFAIMQARKLIAFSSGSAFDELDFCRQVQNRQIYLRLSQLKSEKY